MRGIVLNEPCLETLTRMAGNLEMVPGCRRSILTARPRHLPTMRFHSKAGAETGKVGWILLWLIGIPVPILLLLFLLLGCT